MTICLYDRTMIEKTAHLGNSSCRHFTCNEDIFYGTKVVVATVYDQLKLSGDLRYFAICSKEISVSLRIGSKSLFGWTCFKTLTCRVAATSQITRQACYLCHVTHSCKTCSDWLLHVHWHFSPHLPNRNRLSALNGFSCEAISRICF